MINCSCIYNFIPIVAGTVGAMSVFSPSFRKRIADLFTCCKREEKAPVMHCNRPATVQRYIDQNFNDISIRQEPTYSKRGRPDYQFPANYCALTPLALTKEKMSAIKEVSELLKQKQVVRILDLGTGNGEWLVSLKDRFGERVIVQGISAVDTRNSAEQLALTSEEYNIGNIENLCSLKGLSEYDLIVSSFTFMHLSDPLGTLCQAYEHLSEEGVLLVDHFNLNGIRTQDLQRLLERAEFEIVGKDSCVDMIRLQKREKHLQLPIAYRVSACRPAKFDDLEKAQIAYSLL